MTAKDQVGVMNDLITSIEDARFRYAQKWYQNIAFFDNNHFVFWNKSTRTIDRVAPPKGKAQRMIPKARRQIKAIQNMTLANEPRWIVLPDDDQDQQGAADVALRTNQFLQEKWDQWNVRRKLETLVLDACNMPVSYLKVGYDKFKSDIYIDNRDAFDVLVPMYINSENFEDSPFIIERLRKVIGELEIMYGKDKVDKIKPDNKSAANDFKDMRLSDKTPEKAPQERKYQTTIVDVMYEKVKKSGTKNVIKCTVKAGDVILDEYEYDSNQYPLVPYQTQSGSFYQPALIEDLIPTNKALDVMVSQIENYTNLMVRGRYYLQKGNAITRMVNEDGEFVQYTTAPPEQQQLYPIPSYLFNQMGNYEKWLEESGVSTSALGKVPKGIRAYKAIESLKQSDYANLRIHVLNLQDTLQKVTERVLDLAAHNYLLPQTIYRMDKDQKDYFDVIGEEGSKLKINKTLMESDKPPVVIKGSFRVKCTIENGLSYTEEGKRDTLRELYTSGLISKRTLLEGFKFGNIADELKRAEEELNISMIETPDFQVLPPEMQKVILQYLSQPDVAVNNPLNRAEAMTKSREAAKSAKATQRS